MDLLKRLLREPLLHFLAIGGLFFIVFTAVNGNSEAPANVIVIGPERIDQLAAGFSSVWNRMPTDQELDALIKEDVREEVYYRDAVRIGLDRNDALVRRRLRLKMEFLIDTSADLLEPAAGELETYFAANEQNYQFEPRLAFEQIYLGEAPGPESIAETLSVLQSDPATDLSKLGQRALLLPGQLGLSSSDAVYGVFGKGFFEQLAKLPQGVWRGPISSTYGLHIVRILDGLPSRTPPLSDVRDDVLRDWKIAKAQEVRDRDYAERRERFVIEISRREPQAAEAL
jgi:hypothetical protein